MNEFEEQRLVSQDILDSQERMDDLSLRPQYLRQYIGQDKVKHELAIYIQAAKDRNESLDHVLLYGPPGLGKTTLAMVIANELGVNIKTTSGPAIEKQGDLVAVLNELEAGDVLFIDEIHRLPRQVEEMLYSAMEDFYIDIIIGQGQTANPIHFTLPPFTLIGATTRAGALSAPLRDRFGIVSHMAYYETADLAEIIKRSASIFQTAITAEASIELGKRSRGTPRIANRLLKRVRDYAQVYGEGTVTTELAQRALDILRIDDSGLDHVDVQLLRTLITLNGGAPVGLSTLAAHISEETETIEDMYEPFLIQNGYIQRTPRGRVATAKAYRHLNMPYQESE